jgi:hypothetical protein
MNRVRYGVFQVGQIWLVSDDDGAKLGFPSRGIATTALAAIVAGHPATGHDVLVTVQEQGGRLRTMLNPNDHLILAPVGNDEAWDAILGTRARAPYPRIASNDE